MNPRQFTSSTYSRGVDPDYKSPFERDLENAKLYFGDDFPGNEGLTCFQCGAVVNLGWRHIAWHEGKP